MVATKSVLIAAASCAVLSEAKPVANIVKSIFKRENAIRGTNDIWAARDVTSEITQAFPQCEATLEKLPADKRPHYSEAAGSVTFVKVPKPCTSEVSALKGKEIDGTAFENKGDSIVISHANPAVLKVFTTHFGYAANAGAASPKSAAQ
ncbi:hypothetical protein OIDMADRAFT_149385 [Oidiodendron maius Zn]|uniref:Uncharacterized protein n=1 Tax=Oidiodendron maius (strain Zn) TaxID=913774 RepID=A0A0C3C5V2_OIDMZ|nr:hypothetical protein OIDMADRAFT_149385 [Oidiodendron maius Zn]